jgi:Mor family transcriptional regulator
MTLFEKVTAAIGPANAEKLRRIVGGECVYVPVLLDTGLERRNARIREARTNGAAIDALMRAHGLSRRQIWNILKES